MAPTNLSSFAVGIHAMRLAWWHRRVFGIRSHLTKKERVVLYALAKACGRRGPICEVGSYVGASACALAAGVRDSRAEAVVVCVDTWSNDAMTEGPRDTWTEFSENTADYRQIIRPVRGLSAETADAAAKAAGAPWSLLFLDGDHSEEGVRRDWAAYRPHLAPGAIVAFHDIGWADGVQRVVAEEVSSRLAWERRLPNLFWGELR